MNAIVLMLALVLLLNTSWLMAGVLIVGVVAFFVVNLIMRQESMLYVPCVMPGMQRPSDNPEGLRSPADRGLDFEDVFLQTSDGVRIHAWFIPAVDEKETAPTFLFCHANAGNIGLRVPNFAQIVTKLKANVLALDYRGYGLSEGTPSEEGLIEDALSAWRWIRQSSEKGEINGRRVFVFGRSLGGAVAIALAHTLQQSGEGPAPRGLILENTFISMSAVVDALFPILAFKSLKQRFLRVKWESIERIKSLEVPLLFLTGEKDEMIPPWHSQALHAASVKSRLSKNVVFPEGSHNDTWEKGGELYWEAQQSFLQDSIGPSKDSQVS